jgi:hypothetical protein
MAIIDKNLEFADATSVGTPNNTTVNVGNVIDLGLAGRNVGDGEPMYFVVEVTTSIGSGGAATVSFLLVSDAVTTPAVDGNQTIHYESDVFALATVVAGFRLVVPLPWGNDGAPDYERYLGFQVRENAGQALNAGAVNAYVTRNPRGWKAYAQGSITG